MDLAVTFDTCDLDKILDQISSASGPRL